LWHVRLPYLLICAVSLNLFAILYAFAFLTPQKFSTTSFSNHIFNSAFFVTNLLILLVIFLIWGLQFYRNSVLKNFYKANNFYSIRLFLLLASTFFLLLFSFLTFQFALEWKMDYLEKKYDLKALIQEKKILEPLLLLNKKSYNLQHNPELEKKVLNLFHSTKRKNIKIYFILLVIKRLRKNILSLRIR